MADNLGVTFMGIRSVELRPVPLRSPAAGEVRVRTLRSLISLGTELTILSGDFPERSAWSSYGKYPFLAGYSAVSEVMEVGADVTSLEVGDRVVGLTPHVRQWVTAASSLTRVPDGALQAAAAPFLALAQIAMNGVRRSKVTWGESVVIFGAGLIGQMAARFCRIAGAQPVIVADVDEGRLARLPAEVQRLAISSTETSALESLVKGANHGRLADVVFEVTGDPGLISGEFQVLKNMEGRFVVLSSPRGSTLFDFHDLCNKPSHTIIGAHNDSHPNVATAANPWTRSRHAEQFFDLIESKELSIAPLVTDDVQYISAPEIYRALLESRSGSLGVLIDWADA